MSDNSIKLLSLEHVTKVFLKGSAKENTAIYDLSLSMQTGESLGIVGESGCGKSTLAKLITLQTPVSSGKILFNGNDITNLRGSGKKKLYENIQMVFQNPYGAFSPRMTIGDFMTEGLRYHKKKSMTEAKQIAKELLEQVEIPVEFMNRFPHELSGGQLQRIVIARALSIEPRLLILDEPTSALDVSVQETFLRILADRLQRDKISCILIGHDLAVVRSVTQRIIIMYAGSIMEILPSETLMSTYEHPYTEDLLTSIFTIRHVRSDIKQQTIQSLEEASERMTGEPGVVRSGCAYQKRCRYAFSKCTKERPQLKKCGDGKYCACFRVEQGSC